MCMLISWTLSTLSRLRSGAALPILTRPRRSHPMPTPLTPQRQSHLFTCTKSDTSVSPTLLWHASLLIFSPAASGSRYSVSNLPHRQGSVHPARRSVRYSNSAAKRTMISDTDKLSELRQTIYRIVKQFRWVYLGYSRSYLRPIPRDGRWRPVQESFSAPTQIPLAANDTGTAIPLISSFKVPSGSSFPKLKHSFRPRYSSILGWFVYPVIDRAKYPINNAVALVIRAIPVLLV